MSRKCRYLQLFHYIIFRVRYNVVIKNCLNFTDRIPSFNYLDQENKKPLKKRGFKGGPTCTRTVFLNYWFSVFYLVFSWCVVLLKGTTCTSRGTRNPYHVGGFGGGLVGFRILVTEVTEVMEVMEVMEVELVFVMNVLFLLHLFQN